MESFDVVILGGGIAGLATAWHLARAGLTDVCVFEREWACGAHASGSNAAIFRSLEADAVGVRMALRTRALLRELAPEAPLLRPTGAVYLASAAHLAPSLAQLEAAGEATRRLTAGALEALVPTVRLAAGHEAVLVPGDGVLDTHGMLQALQGELRRLGVSVRVSAEAMPARGAAGFTVATPGGPVSAKRLVLAGGAWNEALGAALGVTEPLQPLRRHLTVLETTQAPAGSPVVWRLEDGAAYFRPESGGALASACDETAWPAVRQVPVDSEALVSLGERLETLAPALAGAQVRRAWGCLRTFAPDRQFVAGPDARVDGLYWCAGLGGRGMTCGLGVGEVVAKSLALGEAPPPEVLPGRRQA